MDESVLPAIVRVLMCTDGTVTRSLQAYFQEPVSVEVVDQHEEILSESESCLNLPPESTVIQRNVRLVGACSQRVFGYARTTLVPERLPAALSEGLTQGRLGVGELLQVRGLETFREILERGIESRGERLIDCVVGRVAWRKYLIHHDGLVLMSIHEYFPLSNY